MSPSGDSDPVRLLEQWLQQARISGVPDPIPMALCTVGEEQRPSARMVGLKQVLDGALIFSCALWSRKARELARNPHVSILFYWPQLGRQIHLCGRAEVAARELSEQLFAERPLAHRLQSIVSRQGEPIEDIDVLRARHAHLLTTLEREPDCPSDWGAIRVVPHTIEFWQQSQDRMHDRLLFQGGPVGWQLQRLAP